MAVVPDNIHVSKISLILGQHSRRFKEAGLAVNSQRKTIEWQQTSSSMLEAVFDSPLILSAEDELMLLVCHSGGTGIFGLRAKNKEIRIPASHLLAATSVDDIENVREWRQVFEKEEVIVHLSSAAHASLPTLSSMPSAGETSSSGELVPTTEHLERECPRFRILVAGKSGVGKSSLINAAFGVRDAQVSKHVPGQADIEREISSERENANFVLHDSLGFESGEAANVDELLQFIKRRNVKPDLKDRLHAIWLCVAVPAAGGRLVETGVEKIMKSKKDGELGGVPIIVVLTKFDRLVNKERRDLLAGASGDKSQDIAKQARDKAKETFKQECIEPLTTQIGVSLAYTVVSTKPSYEDTLLGLVQLTFDHVSKRGETAASVVTAKAQKINPDVKIKGSIIVGRANYWKCLTISFNIPGKKLQDYLSVIHVDIIAVWAFNDPKLFLSSKEFKIMMSKLVDDEEVPDRANPNTGLRLGLPAIATIGTIVGLLSGPAAPIVVPIAGGLVFAKWVYDVCRYSQITLARLIAYIIDLTLVMELLFHVLDDLHTPMTRRIVKCAHRSYMASERLRRVHTAVLDYSKEMATLKPGAKDRTVSKIEELIAEFKAGPKEVARAKRDLQKRISESTKPDESWEEHWEEVWETSEETSGA